MGARRVLASLGVAVGTALFAGLGGLGAAPASAHAYLASSSPGDGASLAAAPTSVELRFTEHVVLESTEIAVIEPDGHRLAPTGLRLVETDEDQEAPATVVATLPALGVGAYHVTWRTLSSDDLHESAGIFAFGIQSEVQAAGPSETNPDLFELLGRWAVLAGIAAGLGAVVVGRLLARLPGGSGGMPRARLRRGAAVALGVAAAAALVVALVDLLRFGAGAFTGGYLLRWALREVCLLAAAAVLATPRTRETPRTRDGMAAAALLGAGLLTVSLGHFGLRGGPTWVLTSTAHLLAGLLWAGSVAALALLGLRSSRLHLSAPEVRVVLRGFRVPATVCVVVVAVTGVYLASDVVVSVDAALLTTYGRVLLAKVVLAGLVGVVALVTTRALHARIPATGRGRRPRVAAEALGLLAVVALAGVLATGQPAVSPRLVTEQAPSVLDDRPVADLQQTLALRPNRPGASVALIDVLDTRRPAPAPVTGVTVTVRPVSGAGSGAGSSAGPGSAAASAVAVDATAVARSRWSAAVELPASGPVDVDVAVHRRGFVDVRSTVHWVVGASSSDPAPLVSRAPLSGLLAGVSAVLALVALLASGLILRRRYRSRGDGGRSGGRRVRSDPGGSGLPEVEDAVSGGRSGGAGSLGGP